MVIFAGVNMWVIFSHLALKTDLAKGWGLVVCHPVHSIQYLGGCEVLQCTLLVVLWRDRWGKPLQRMFNNLGMFREKCRSPVLTTVSECSVWSLVDSAERCGEVGTYLWAARPVDWPCGVYTLLCTACRPFLLSPLFTLDRQKPRTDGFHKRSTPHTGCSASKRQSPEFNLLPTPSIK